MKEFFKNLTDHNVGSWVVMLISITLIVASFILPPTGIIDSSVLGGVGEIGFLGIVFFRLDDMIKSIKGGTNVTFRSGDKEVTVSKDKKD